MDRSGRLAESGPVGGGQVSVPEEEVHVQQLLMLKKIFEVRGVGLQPWARASENHGRVRTVLPRSFRDRKFRDRSK